MREPGESVPGFLGALAPLGRSSRFDLRRLAALRGPELLEKAADVRGSGAEADARRARLLRLAGREEEAAALYALALARSPGLPAALAGRWELAASRGSAPGGDLDRALAAEPGNAAWRAWRGLRLVARGREPGDDLLRASRAGGTAGALGLLGRALARLRAGDARGALKPLDAAVALAPREGWLRRLRAKARFRAGDEDGFVADCQAETLLDEGIGTFAFPFGVSRGYDPRALAGRLDAALRRRPGTWWLLALRGDCRRAPEVDDHAGGLADLEAAALASPRPGWILGHAARARLSMGDAAGAAAAARAAVAAEPRCGWLRAWRGALRAKAGDPRGALPDFDAAAALDPDYELTYLWRGAARGALGRHAEALEDLDLAGRLSPSNPGVWRLRARSLRGLGRAAEAALSERRARAGDPRETEARRRRDAGADFDLAARA